MLDMFGAWATQWLSKNRHLTNNKWHSSHSYNHEIARVQLCNIPSYLPWLNPLPPSPQQKRRNTFWSYWNHAFPVCVFSNKRNTYLCRPASPPSFRENKNQVKRSMLVQNKRTATAVSQSRLMVERSFEPPCWYGMIRSPAVDHFTDSMSPQTCREGKIIWQVNREYVQPRINIRSSDLLFRNCGLILKDM